MSLLVTNIKSPDSVALAESSKTFDLQGGSIGRGKNNFWVLDDPERFLSSTHCQFSCENGQYYITDLSTNGTFYNGSGSPMGKGTKLPVFDGDSFALGDYKFSVNILSSDSLTDPFSNNNDFLEKSDDVFDTDALTDPFVDSSMFASTEKTDDIFSSSQETDPLAALDKAQGGKKDPVNWGAAEFGGSDNKAQSPSAADPFVGLSHSDQADPLNQQVSWPDSVPEQAPQSGGIPDDWDDDSLTPSAPVRPATQAPVTDLPARHQAVTQSDVSDSSILLQQNKALKEANAKLQAEFEILKLKLGEQQRSGAKTEIMVDTTLVDAMGFQNLNLTDAEIVEINQLVGEIFREMVKGLMQVLRSRNSIKSEFRMNVTTIQPVENNPLKFSATVDDALENMFVKHSKAYINPVAAVRESYETIAEHQVAILAGIRQAFKTVIGRFDPVLLEARFSRHNKGSLIPGSQKAKNWELYLDYYNEMIGDIDNTFQYLFGDDFVHAYEEQLQKLLKAKKYKKSEKENK